MTEAELQQELERHDYIFAKTAKNNPHWYTLRKNWHDNARFDECVLAIREHGARELFWEKPYICFYDAERRWKYWTMGSPVPETILINRAHIAAPEESGL